MKAEQIALKTSELKPVVDELNDLLANYHIYYQNLRGCHWNVKGANFFTLHLKFEALYTQALTAIDEIAERVLTLGKPPYSTLQQYIDVSAIKQIDTIGMKDMDMVKHVVDNMDKLIAKQRELLKTTEEASDDGTNDLVNKLMQFLEKEHWMLRSFLEK
ncbi:MAG TPA: DNA starvation/stationary phase protection protein [Chitinophagaceae bacterium]|nr:DNA starvation/stationary phase protection protein [Chitinophagaceae bacterium]